MPDKIMYDGQGMPYYDPTKWKDYGEFTAAALNDIQRIKSQQTAQENQTIQQNGTTLGRFAGAALPALGATAGEMVEPAGGGVVGAAAGSAAKSALRSKFPGVFGENPPTTVGQASDIGTDVALEGLGPSLAKAFMNSGTIAKMVGNHVGSAVGSRIAGFLSQHLPSASPTMQKHIIDGMRAMGVTIKMPGDSSSQ